MLCRSEVAVLLGSRYLAALDWGMYAHVHSLNSSASPGA